MFQNTSCAPKYDRASGNLNQFSPEFKIFHVDLLLIGNAGECLCVFNWDLNRLEANQNLMAGYSLNQAVAARPDLSLNNSHQV